MNIVKRVVAGALSSVLVYGTAEANELLPSFISSGVVPCSDGEMGWHNPENVGIKIKQVTIWTGLDYGGKADMAVWVYNFRGPVVIFGNDRYNNPAEQSTHTWSYGQDYVSVPFDAGLLITWHCQAFGSVIPSTNIVVQLLYTMGQ